ncbi:MAG TPA: hypothetical protein VN880_06595 [Solirubrobacteraceae bacterium]|nr:hypothetical protein [Solirubrobacteraceae bacterium]
MKSAELNPRSRPEQSSKVLGRHLMMRRTETSAPLVIHASELWLLVDALRKSFDALIAGHGVGRRVGPG